MQYQPRKGPRKDKKIPSDFSEGIFFCRDTCPRVSVNTSTDSNEGAVSRDRKPVPYGVYREIATTLTGLAMTTELAMTRTYSLAQGISCCQTGDNVV